MISRIALATALALAPQAVAAEAAAPPGKIAITFEASLAVASGITPGATVVWLGVSRAREEWSDHFYHWRTTTEDTDKDGIVTYPRKEGFPQMTIMVAVELTAGAYGVGATYPLGNVPPPDFRGARSDSTGLLASFVQPGTRVDLLVVRAGVGAWAARVLDGSPLDADGLTDGTVTVGLSSLPSRAGTAGGLDGLRLGDIVAMVDANGPSVRVGPYAGQGVKE